jgi:Acetyl-CoA hydrolase
VVPRVTHVDHTEHDVDAVVTEHGVADLRGLSPTERAECLVDCAAPVFRSRLRGYLDDAREGGGHLPYDPEAALDWRR